MRKIIPILILLSACSPTKQAAKFTHKALSKDTATTVGIIRAIAPCVTTKIDTSAPVIVTNTVIKTDTVNTVRIDTLKCKDGEIITRPCIAKTIYINRTDTVKAYYDIVKTKRDMADSIIYTSQISTMQSSFNKEHGKREFWFIWAIIVTGLLLLYIIFNLIKSKL